MGFNFLDNKNYPKLNYHNRCNMGNHRLSQEYNHSYSSLHLTLRIFSFPAIKHNFYLFNFWIKNQLLFLKTFSYYSPLLLYFLHHWCILWDISINLLDWSHYRMMHEWIRQQCDWNHSIIKSILFESMIETKPIHYYC